MAQNFFYCVRRAANKRSAWALAVKPNASKGEKPARTWRNFEIGAFVPSDQTIDKVEAQLGIPIRHEIYAPLWVALDLSIDVASCANAVVRISDCSIHRPAGKILDAINASSDDHPVLLRATREVQMCFCNLHHFGCLLLLARLAHHKKQFNVVEVLGVPIYQALCALAPELHERGILVRTYALCKYQLFPALGVTPFETFKKLTKEIAKISLTPWMLEKCTHDKILDWQTRIEWMTAWLSRRRRRSELRALAASGGMRNSGRRIVVPANGQDRIVL